MPVPVPELHIDVLIFGGGIAGLWTLARLRKEGYSCLLLESNALGAGQTIASQGIIHGGVKYALGGEADASNALAGMPGRWRDALEGRGPVELPSAAILSEHQYLWTTPGLASRVAGLGATALLRSGVERVPPAQRPEIFQGAKGIDVYRTAEPVLDPRVVIEALAGHAPGCLRRYAGADQVQFELPEGPGWVRTAIVDHVSQKPLLHILPRFVVLAAGAGNAMLQGRLGVSPGVFVQQLRPLHMVMARGLPAPLFGHCLGMSAVPRLTVTSARMGDEWVWWIGGALDC